MTLETVLAWSTARSLMLTTLGLLIAIPISSTIGRTTFKPTVQKLWIAAALLPLFVPDLLIGFAYRLVSAELLHSVAATEALYAALLLTRIVALQFAVQLMLPCSAVSIEALHSWKLVRHRNPQWWLTWLRLQVSGPARAALVAWLGGAMLCFQEFETAALLQIDRHPIAWTVWLFDAHAAGEPLASSLSLAAPALAVQCAWLIPCLWLLLNGSAFTTLTASAAVDRRTDHSRVISSFATAVIVLSVGFVFCWPIFSHTAELAGGIRNLIGTHSLWARSQQVLASLMECVLAAYLALQLCSVARSLKPRSLKLLLVLPGLCSPLVLSLSLLALFQLPVLHQWYDTWLPMLLGHVLLLLPRAMLLVTVLSVLTAAAARHSGDLLFSADHPPTKTSARQLSWTMHKQKWLLALALLTHWCFWDVTIAATLRPVLFEPVVTRLYNEMHYGHTEALVAMTGLALLIPVLVFALAGLVWHRIETK